MKIDTTTYKEINRPMYILEEARLRNNLRIISDVAKRADVRLFLRSRLTRCGRRSRYSESISTLQQQARCRRLVWLSTSSAARRTLSHQHTPTTRLTRLLPAQVILRSTRSHSTSVCTKEHASRTRKSVSDCASILSIRRLRPTYTTLVRRAHASE